MWTRTLIGMGDPEMNRTGKPKPGPEQDKAHEEAKSGPADESSPEKE